MNDRAAILRPPGWKWQGLPRFHVAALLLSFALPASATILTNTPGKDNTIYETSGSTNYLSNGAGDTLTAGRIDLSKGGGWRRRSLIAFTNLHLLEDLGGESHWGIL